MCKIILLHNCYKINELPVIIVTNIVTYMAILCVFG